MGPGAEYSVTHHPDKTVSRHFDMSIARYPGDSLLPSRHDNLSLFGHDCHSFHRHHNNQSPPGHDNSKRPPILRPGMIENLAKNVEEFTSNAFLVTGQRTVLVDAGNGFDIVTKLRDRVETLDAVVLTHTHPDHVGNLQAVTNAFDVDVWGYDLDASGVDHELTEDETLTIGDHEYTVMHTPGHKNDHVCLYAVEPAILFAGDLIFENGGFGRTDLAEGDRQQLLESIDRVLETVDSDLAELHTGHGRSVTVDPYQTIELAAQAARMR